MDMASHEQKMAMHKRMEKMKVAMAKIKAETDIKTREKLMQAQIQNMEDCMDFMQSMLELKHAPSSAGHEHKGN